METYSRIDKQEHIVLIGNTIYTIGKDNIPLIDRNKYDSENSFFPIIPSPYESKERVKDEHIYKGHRLTWEKIQTRSLQAKAQNKGK